ncbi:MAG: PEP-utilizing enzyme [Dehalococcoidia bacterium]
MTRESIFQLPDPAFEQYTWVLQDEHGPSSLPPLLVYDDSYGPGTGGVPRSLRIHGFHYVRAASRPRRPEWSAGTSAPSSLSADVVRRWRHEWLPEVESVVRLLEDFDPASVASGQWGRTLNRQEEQYWRVFSGIHSTAPGPARQAFAAYAYAFERRFGDARSEDMHALVQGVDNCSVDRAGALWDLSRILRANPELLQALDRGAALPDSPASRQFSDAFAAMIATYGHTSNSDLQDLPVWREDHDIPMAAVRAYARQDDAASPRAAHDRQRARRLELEAELRRLAVGGDEAVARILALLPAAQELIPNSEDHNFLADQRQIAASRHRWMSIGRHLMDRGLIDAADDVFFIETREILAVLEGHLVPDRALLAERKRRLRAARASAPPPVLGRPLEREDADPESAMPSPLTGGSMRVIRGVAASPGSFRGRARLIETLEEAGSLVEGDVMVVRSTTPPWTPFFALASALVTNSGGMLSHAAVVAREFGIPAVVGTSNATALIPDGATVTVDGTRGIVIIE